MIDEIHNEGHGIDEEIYESQVDFSDIEDDLICTYLHVVRCLHTISRFEVRHSSNIFHTYVTYNDKNNKVMIDRCNCVNIISKSIVEMMASKLTIPTIVRYLG